MDLEASSINAEHKLASTFKQVSQSNRFPVDDPSTAVPRHTPAIWASCKLRGAPVDQHAAPPFMHMAVNSESPGKMLIEDCRCAEELSHELGALANGSKAKSQAQTCWTLATPQKKQHCRTSILALNVQQARQGMWSWPVTC